MNPSPPSKLPLSGLRVLAVEQYGAGPFGTSYLADLGAEVIKIENHKDGGDVGRHVGPHFFGPDDSHFFQTFNRNKKSLTVDLKHPEGSAVFRKLVAGADAIHLSGYSFVASSPRRAVLGAMAKAGETPVSVDPASAEFLR